MTCSFFFSRANCFLFLLCKLILTPAASVAPVQSDLPAVTSCSSASNASQVYKHIRACQPLICCLPTSGCYRQLAWANLQEENSQVTSHEYNKHFFFFFAGAGSCSASLTWSSGRSFDSSSPQDFGLSASVKSGVWKFIRKRTIWGHRGSGFNPRWVQIYR